MISLRARVTLSASLVLAIFLILTALALERAFEKNAYSAMRDRLFAQLYLVMAETEIDREGRPQMPELLGEPRLNLPGSGLYALITTADGDALWQSSSAIGLSLAGSLPRGTPKEYFIPHSINGETFFIARLAIEWESDKRRFPLIFSAIENSDPYEEQLQSYRRNLWTWLGGMALLLLITQGVVLSWGLRPLHTAAKEIKAIESGSQEALLKKYPSELGRLTDNINTLITQEHAQQNRYKNALSDLAHSLKTPLAILRGLDLSKPDSGESSHTLEEQVTRMDTIVQYQLQRASTAGRSALAPPLSIKPVAERLLATLTTVYRDKAITIENTIDEEATFRGDESDLLELLGNLLDNAFKWCDQNVLISAHCNERTVSLSVEDDGPGIDQERVSHVLQRGGRIDESTPGHGIGLPMVQDIVAAYGGTLEIVQSNLGGASVRIKLPGCV